MATVTVLFICISSIYTYSYNFNYLASLLSVCVSIFSVTCSMSLAYLLSILLLYSCFYTLHIPILLIFHISHRSIRLILLLPYHILSYVFTYVFMCFHILYFSYTFLFYLLSVLYLFISFSCTILCTFYILYSCTVHVLFSYTYIHVLFISYTFFLLNFSYDCHILCFSSYTVIYYTFI